MLDINKKIDFWKNRLLDTSKRNKLINCPIPKSKKRNSRSFLLIKQPNYSSLWETLTENNQQLIFPSPIYDDDLNDELDDDLDDDLDDIWHDTFGTHVTTNQTPFQTSKTLYSMMKKAKEFQEEKGLNALYLAFGFLNWQENGKEGQEIRSPLILMPVKLTQEDLFSPIKLSYLDEETTTNYSLEQKLINDFGIELPHFDESNLDDYLNKVEQIVRKSGWNIEREITQLGLFSFTKINMYRDMEHNSSKIAKHNIIRAINGERIENGEVTFSDITNYNHDKVEPAEVFSVLDADSSQQDAIMLAKSGKSFVLQGPPGTGKSQTITNIIAELIGDGKKVLFVSEKMAALEVVYKRLSEAGLSDFCLTLHSHKAKRLEIIKQFDRSLRLSRKRLKLQQDAFNKWYRLEETRKALNQYSIDLHTAIPPLDRTIYEINGFITEYEEYPSIDYVQKNVENFTPQLLAECEISLEELTRVVKESSYHKDNPWSGCILTKPLEQEFRQRFSSNSKPLIAQIKEGISIFDKSNAIMGNSNLDWNWSNIYIIKYIFDLAKDSPEVNANFKTFDHHLAINNLDGCINYITDYKTLEANILNFKKTEQSINTAIQHEDLIKCEQTLANNNIFIALEEYNSTLEAVESLGKINNNLEDNLKIIREKRLDSKKIYETEQAKTDIAKAEWQTTQKNLFKHCAEDVLSLDTTNMLKKYHNTYNSNLKRLFSSEYRKDKNSLLVHYRVANKLNYEQSISLLAEIETTRNLKEKFDKQFDETTHAKMLLNEIDFEYKRISEELISATNSLSNAKEKYNRTKDMLKSSLSKVISEYEQQLSKKKQDFLQTDQCIYLKQLLYLEVTIDSNFEILRATIEWCNKFNEQLTQYQFDDSFIQNVCNSKRELFDKIDKNITELQNWKTLTEASIMYFFSLFDDQEKERLEKIPLKVLLERIESCSFSKLEYLLDYRAAITQLEDLGLNSYLEKIRNIELNADMIIGVFRKCFYRSWLDAFIPRFTSLSEFRRRRQEERIKAFQDYDITSIEVSKANLTAKLVSRLPNFDIARSDNELSLLQREMKKQRKLMPIRKLIAALPNLLPTLKPCLMMSPLSVSTYVGNSNYEFDTVIFDEASQIKTEDAVCAIYRAKQAIIVGDSKQLPPTNFFNSTISNSDDLKENEDEDVNDLGAFESLLDEATSLPTHSLRWHYRSRHEDLIAFSNLKIYQQSLITFPSSIQKKRNIGVEYIHVVGGTYDSGGKNGNKAEANRVADLVFEHFEQHPGRSLGIIAFSETQQTAILDTLIKKRKINPSFEKFFNEDLQESIFVKNLETVQGDERDTIIFSIGYAPNTAGKFTMNFGPLSNSGGERRLNVAITRARYNLKLVGSILPIDIDIERVSKEGPKLLRLYIDFAINGMKALLGENTFDTNPQFDSPFEKSVYNFLTKHKYDVVTQVGCSGYRIDMAVRHPKYNGRFAIGIECDGATYHGARTARERDRLRQTILEDMGWKIYRIWSTDWVKDCHTEGNLLLAAVQKAIDNYREIAPVTKEKVKDQATDLMVVNTLSAAESIREGEIQRRKLLQSHYCGQQAKDIPNDDFANTMIKVLENSSSLDKDGLFKETALYGYNWMRQGDTIKKKFEKAYSSLLKARKISILEDKKIKLIK